jgi:cell division cycle protein 20 (cofactor of APC complex)
MDRFIPTRENSASTATSLSASSSSDPPTQTSVDDEHTQDLTAALDIDLSKRILSFSSEPPPSSNEHAGLLAAYARTPKKATAAVPVSQRRRIATMPTRVLDAPNLLDDYYLNLLDWSPTNIVAIALEHQVYVWNAESGDVSRLVDLNPEDESGAPGDDYVCAVKFSDDGSYLAVGTSTGPIQIYDVAQAQKIRTMAGHLSRVPSLSWSGAVLSSGSRDGAIWNSDVRVAQHKQSEMKGHRAEICGLAWRPDNAGGLSGGGQGVRPSLLIESS